MGKHLEQALPSVYTLQCLTGKVDNNKIITSFMLCPLYVRSTIIDSTESLQNNR